MYSQNNEEKLILDLFGNVKHNKCRFLDIGAYDGRTISNTFRLAELGWSGVCVEPSPTAFTKLFEVYRKNLDISLVNSAISVDGGWTEFYLHDGGLSSSSLSHVKFWRNKIGTEFVRVYLKTVSINELFSKFGINYEFINLDTEGTNWALFQSLPWKLLNRTKVICVEHDNFIADMEKLALQYGFKLVDQNYVNIILARF